MESHVAPANRLFHRIALYIGDFAGLLLVAIVVLVNVEVVLRYVFGSSTLIADEYSGYFFVWMSLLGFGYAIEMGQFLRVEAFVERVQGAPRNILELLSAIVCATLAAITAYGCAVVFLINWRFGTPSVQPSATPLWLPQIVMPVAFAWLVVLYTRIAAVRICRLAGGGAAE